MDAFGYGSRAIETPENLKPVSQIIEERAGFHRRLDDGERQRTHNEQGEAIDRAAAWGA